MGFGHVFNPTNTTRDEIGALHNEVAAGSTLTPEQRAALIDYTYKAWGVNPNDTNSFSTIVKTGGNPDLQGLASVGDAELVARANRGFNYTQKTGTLGSDLVSFYGPIFAGGLVGAGLGAALGLGTAPATTAATEGAVVPTSGGSAGVGAGGVFGTGAEWELGLSQLPGSTAGGPTGGVVGGAATVGGGVSGGAAGGATGGAAAVTGGTALSRIMDGSATAADWLSIGGNVAGAGLGYLGAERQGERLDALARDYMALGAPSRARYEASFGPNFDVLSLPGFKESMDTASESMLRKLSAKSGNPVGDPGGLAEIQKYLVGNLALPAISDYRRINAGAGGLAALTSAAPATAAGAIAADAGRFDAIGGALADITNPRRNIYDYMKEMRSLG